jgi:hypothetical protein
MNTPNDQYVPPTMYNLESPLVPASAEVEKSHEWGNFVRSIEHSIENFRKQADVTTLENYENKGRFRNLAYKAFKMPLSNEEVVNELINKEALAGGKMLPTGPDITSQMFWYFQDDWFYQITEGSKANGFTALTVRYQVRNDELLKSVGATPVPLGDGEPKAFTTWIQQYHALLANGIYKDLNDTMIDDQLDYIMDDVDDVLAHKKSHHGSRDDYGLAS